MLKEITATDCLYSNYRFTEDTIFLIFKFWCQITIYPAPLENCAKNIHCATKFRCAATTEDVRTAKRKSRKNTSLFLTVVTERACHILRQTCSSSRLIKLYILSYYCIIFIPRRSPVDYSKVVIICGSYSTLYKHYQYIYYNMYNAHQIINVN